MYWLLGRSPMVAPKAFLRAGRGQHFLRSVQSSTKEPAAAANAPPTTQGPETPMPRHSPRPDALPPWLLRPKALVCQDVRTLPESQLMSICCPQQKDGKATKPRTVFLKVQGSRGCLTEEILGKECGPDICLSSICCHSRRDTGLTTGAWPGSDKPVSRRRPGGKNAGLPDSSHPMAFGET